MQMKMWEILKKSNIGKIYKRTDCDCEYKYKVELRNDDTIELVSYSPYDDRMGFVHGNSMTFEWTYKELVNN